VCVREKLAASNESIEGPRYILFQLRARDVFFFCRSECVRLRLAASNESNEGTIYIFFFSIEDTKQFFFGQI